MHTVVGLMICTAENMIHGEIEQKILNFDSLSDEDKESVSSELRSHILDSFDNYFYENVFDWRTDDPGRWKDHYSFKRDGLIIGKESPEDLIAMIKKFSERPLKAATVSYLRSKYYNMGVQKIEELLTTVEKFNKEHDMDIKIYHILDKPINEYGKYDILYADGWFEHLDVFMNIYPETSELLISLKKWDDGISKEQVIHEIRNLVKYANNDEVSLRDMLAESYMRYYRDKKKGYTDESFNIWQQNQITKLISGEFTYDSGFYMINEGSTLMNKYELDEIEKHPENYALLIIDMHY